MTIVVAVHGAAGSGKTTLIRVMKEHLGSQCLVAEEDTNFMKLPATIDDKKKFWFQRTTLIHNGDNITHFIIGKVSPLSLIIFTTITYLITGTLWPIVVLTIGLLTFSRLMRRLRSQIISSLWSYNVIALFDHERKTNCKWIWRDRTCIDVYAFCIMGNATAVPLNMPEILLEQTRSTSVAILMDLSQSTIEGNLRARINARSSSPIHVFLTRLLLIFRTFTPNIIRALTLTEQWYTEMNVPVIKISQIREKLDFDSTTGNIQWTQHSIDVLLQTIQRANEQRQPTPSTIKDYLMPWQTIRKPHLCLY